MNLIQILILMNIEAILFSVFILSTYNRGPEDEDEDEEWLIPSTTTTKF